MAKLSESEQFFYENAGYSYDSEKETKHQGHVRYAKQLAHAEQVAQNMQWAWEWKEDLDANANGEYPEATEVLGCILYDPAERKRDKYASLESLWGIADPTPEYMRVIEAELALEAEAALDREIEILDAH